jgi:hypothetical protein
VQKGIRDLYSRGVSNHAIDPTQRANSGIILIDPNLDKTRTEYLLAEEAAAALAFLDVSAMMDTFLVCGAELIFDRTEVADHASPVTASEAKQSSAKKQVWIASSLRSSQ